MTIEEKGKSILIAHSNATNIIINRDFPEHTIYISLCYLYILEYIDIKKKLKVNTFFILLWNHVFSFFLCVVFVSSLCALQNWFPCTQITTFLYFDKRSIFSCVYISCIRFILKEGITENHVFFCITTYTQQMQCNYFIIASYNWIRLFAIYSIYYF
jgi:hypothetical protein